MAAGEAGVPPLGALGGGRVGGEQVLVGHDPSHVELAVDGDERGLRDVGSKQCGRREASVIVE